MRLPLIAALATLATATAAEPTAPRIVGCEDAVRSSKRGVCANKLGAADFAVLAPGVSWFYNWHFTTDMAAPADGPAFDFIPMVWGDFDGSYTGLEQRLAAGPRPPVVFAINEPNLKGQAFITPEACAKAFLRVKAIADKHGIPVVGPHMALGSSPGDSITAFDPLEQKDVTYGWFVPYLKAFAHFVGPAAKDMPVGVHAYKDIHELKWSIDAAHKQTGGPVWMTEFAQWSAADERAEIAFMMQAVDHMERTPHVAGYAWFKERSDNKRISMFASESGKLTALGEAYVRMPVHDADLYYRLPGRLQAERYRAADKADIAATADGDGFADMVSGGGGWLDLNVAVDAAGQLDIALRLDAEPGTIALSRAGKPLASITVEKAGWQTVTAKAKLPAGTQTIRVQLPERRARINWIEFSR